TSTTAPTSRPRPRPRRSCASTRTTRAGWMPTATASRTRATARPTTACRSRGAEAPAMLLLGWASRELRVVLPVAEAWAICDRARRFDVEAGGRFDLRHGRTIVLWSPDKHPDGGRGVPVGIVRFSRRDPDLERATITRIGWDAALGAEGEADVWRALEVLSGGAIAPP